MIEQSGASGVIERTRRLYGESPLPMDGVLHVVAIHASRRVMKIGPATPKSETDFFVLQLARTRASAVLVSGAVLRAEPELTYDAAPPFRAWRDAVGLRAPLVLAVLSGGDVPLAHPALHGWARPLILTGIDAASRLARDAPPHVEIVALPEPSARAALDHLRGRFGSIAIEAGPRTAVPLYDDPLAVDELMLSVYEGPLDPSLDAGAFLTEDELRARGLDRVSACEVREPSGPWRFERWLRAHRKAAPRL